MDFGCNSTCFGLRMLALAGIGRIWIQVYRRNFGDLGLYLCKTFVLAIFATSLPMLRG